MKEYHKIQSVFKRDHKTHKLIEGAWSLPEFDYLKDNHWIWTEKVDGTNVRVLWHNSQVQFAGRTANAQMPTFLYAKLQELFPVEKFQALYPEIPMCLYGEGYGAKIQKGGGNYKADGVDFVLFDVRIDDWWLERPNVEDIATKLEIETVPIVGRGTLSEAAELIKTQGLVSEWNGGSFLAEGMVLRPEVELQDRAGRRIITKIKHKDF